MTSPPEIKYSDRDVREDYSLTAIAVQYVKDYAGEFEPLVDAQTELKEHGRLDPVTVRKVLNCMRHDRDWKGKLPVPKRRIPPVTDPDPLNPVRRARGKNWRDGFEKKCNKKEPHDPHTWDKESRSHWCTGVRFKINRPEMLRMPTRIKLPYACARHGSYIHLTEGTGYALWWPNRHSWGWHKPDGYRFQEPKGHSWHLIVNLRCKNPGRLTDPVLISNDELMVFLENARKIRKPDAKICPRCLPNLIG